MPGIDNQKLEKSALLNGTLVQETQGRKFYVFKSDKIVGYNEGQPTQWMRAEITPSNIYHGHPISEQSAMEYLRKVSK